jgi:hypothetical protein
MERSSGMSDDEAVAVLQRYWAPIRKEIERACDLGRNIRRLGEAMAREAPDLLAKFAGRNEQDIIELMEDIVAREICVYWSESDEDLHASARGFLALARCAAETAGEET